MDTNPILYEWIGEHVAFQMTPRLPDLDNSQTFYARIYEAFSAWIRTGIAQTMPDSAKNKEAVGKELAHPLEDISNYCKYGYETYMNR